MSVVSMKNLLEAGVHFGHQTRRWNPKMKPYIFTERNGIYILDLQRTLREIETAYMFTRDIAARGGKVLFVGTKKQAQEGMQTEAERSGMPYVNQRWLGGMLTNFVTMRTRVSRMEELEAMEENGNMAKLPKKEQILLRKEHAKLYKNLEGVRTMTELPQAIFVVDTKRETIGIAEARRLHIPIIGLVDTNADPDEVDYVIPGNDDAIRAVSLVCRVIGDAVLEGRAANEGPAVYEAEPRPEPIVVPADAISQDPAVAEAATETVVEETAADAEVLVTGSTTVEQPLTADVEAPAAEAPAEEPAVEEPAAADAEPAKDAAAE